MSRHLLGEAIEIAGPQQTKLAASLCLPQGSRPARGWPVVAAFHGLTLSQHFFYDLVAPLNEKGIALLGVDFRGHGASQGVLEETTLQRQTRDVAAVLKSLASQPGIDLKSVSLLGFSMGAVPVLEALRQAQIQPKALVLWAPLLNTAEWSQRRLRGFTRINAGKVCFWKGRVITASLFTDAQCLDPQGLAGKWPGPVFVAHADKDENQLPGESRALVSRRQKNGLETQGWFPPQSAHLFGVAEERRELIIRTSCFLEKYLCV